VATSFEFSTGIFFDAYDDYKILFSGNFKKYYTRMEVHEGNLSYEYTNAAGFGLLLGIMRQL
jgi:hypothetical protein